MRLSHKEIKAIKEAFHFIFLDYKYELYLFGSRTDQNKKGGDIDLLVCVEDSNKSFFIENKIRVLIKIFEKIEEQKIDITIATKHECETDTFLESISKTKILLNCNLV